MTKLYKLDSLSCGEVHRWATSGNSTKNITWLWTKKVERGSTNAAADGFAISHLFPGATAGPHVPINHIHNIALSCMSNWAT